MQGRSGAAGAIVQYAIHEQDRAVRGIDCPIHIGKTTRKERGHPRLDPVVRLEPGGETAARAIGGDFAEPDEGFHFMRVARDCLCCVL